MFCHKCGEKIKIESARFCPECGSDLNLNHSIELEKVESKNEPTSITREEMSKKKGKFDIKSIFLPVLIPIFSLILASCIGYFYYTHQFEVNQQVLHLKDQSNEKALKGKYKEALSLVKEAMNLRPSYKVLQENEQLFSKALELDHSINDLNDLLKTQELEKADSQITKLKEELNELKGPRFTPLHNKLEEKTVTLAVAKIKKEIDSLKTVDQLASKLNTLSSLKSEESEMVSKLILAKIVNFTTKDVEKQLKEKQFSDAIDTVEKGLDFVNNDTKLTSLKERILKEQTAFENAEQKRIEQALEVAAQEDLSNHTSAVSIESLDVYVDEFGDLHVSGEVKNTATVPISSITLYYDITDSSGNLIGSDLVYVDSFYLQPGESAYYEGTYYGVNQDVTVNIDHITWLLN